MKLLLITLSVPVLLVGFFLYWYFTRRPSPELIARVLEKARIYRNLKGLPNGRTSYFLALVVAMLQSVTADYQRWSGQGTDPSVTLQYWFYSIFPYVDHKKHLLSSHSPFKDGVYAKLESLSFLGFLFETLEASFETFKTCLCFVSPGSEFAFNYVHHREETVQNLEDALAIILFTRKFFFWSRFRLAILDSYASTIEQALLVISELPPATVYSPEEPSSSDTVAA